MLRYLCSAQTLFEHSHGWLETSPRVDLLICATEAANSALRAPRGAIEDVLAQILDPDQRVFTQ